MYYSLSKNYTNSVKYESSRYNSEGSRDVRTVVNLYSRKT